MPKSPLLIELPGDFRDRVRAYWARTRKLLKFANIDPKKLEETVNTSPIALAGNVIGSAVFALLMWDLVDPAPLLVWLALTWAICAGIYLRGRQARARTYDRVSRRAVHRSIQVAILLATPWAWMSAAYMGEISAQIDAILFGICAGLSAAGGFLLSRVPPAALAYMATILIPSLIKGIDDGLPSHLMMSIFGLVYAVFLVVIVLHYARAQFERDESVRSLSAQMVELTRARNDIAQLATRDSVTGLRNRHEFNRRLSDTLNLAIARGKPIRLMIIDIDHFKNVNDTLGHTAGDELLRILGERLEAACPQAEIVARLGGDEFAVLDCSDDDEHDPTWRVQRVLQELSAPVDLNGVHMATGCSIGIAEYPQNATSSEELMSFADIALHAAKDNGRGIVCFFDENMKNRIHHDARLEKQLRRAIEAEQLELLYQPQFELTNARLIGFEALIRWNHPERGTLTPEQFLPLAEDKGLILDISDFVMQRALSDTSNWLALSLDPGRIAVNIHATQLKQPERLLNHLAIIASGNAGGMMALEITEGCVVGRGTERIPTLLRKIRDAGTSISLDDFGTGYASLTHLKELPVDEIKIDRQFTGDLLKEGGDSAIPRAIIDMARALGIGIVAEGIETQEQAERLAELGCPAGQGYFYSKPVDWACATRFLKGGVWRTQSAESAARQTSSAR